MSASNEASGSGRAVRPALPPGQREARLFPRFGLPTFALRLPVDPGRIEFDIRGDVQVPLTVTARELQDLPRSGQRSDFHCVTTWSVRDQEWGGIRFADFYRQFVVPRAKPLPGAHLVVIRGCDRYVSSLPLEDALRDDVLLADQLSGQPLGVDHGAPLRLVAPAHYGYKNVKHVVAIEFWSDRRGYRFPFPYPSLMEHPRARVALEERGRLLPSWLFRLLYRPLIAPTILLFRWALRRSTGTGG